MNILVATPCQDFINSQAAMSLLSLTSNDDIRYRMTLTTMVYDARNDLTEAAFEVGADRVMWIDSDMIVPRDIIDRLGADLDEGRDFVSALYFSRKEERKPVLFENLSFERKGQYVTPHADFYMDYPKDSVFRIAGCGFGACLMNIDVLKKVNDKYGAPFNLLPGFGEDISFCYRCREIGIDVWCDSRVKCGHIGQYIFTEEDYK